MNGLREDYPNTFNSSNFAYSLGGDFKRINLYNSEMDAVIIGNFGVETASGLPNFPYTGTWYDYFSGESIVENNLNNQFQLAPGEYRVYTSEPLEQPDITISVPELDATDLGVSLYPSVADQQITVELDMGTQGRLDIWVYDSNGREVKRLVNGTDYIGEQLFVFDVSDLASGHYQVLVGIEGRAQLLDLIRP